MFAVVEALDVFSRGRVIGTPDNHKIKLASNNMLFLAPCVNTPVHMVHYV